MTNKLLIVDDELFIRELLQELCSNLGYEVRVAGTHADTLALVEREEFGAAIVDLRLKDASGIEVIKMIKDRHPDLSVVLMTGYPSVDSVISAMRLGAADCIVKPFRLREIANSISNACAETRRRVEIRGLRERITELETRAAGVKRKSSRRLVISQPSRPGAGKIDPLDFVNRVYSESDSSLAGDGSEHHTSVDDAHATGMPSHN